jgi:RimJ/RimL family protein N-acetyltransferase
MPDRVCLSGRLARLEPIELEHVDDLLAAATEDRATYGFTPVPDTTAAMRAYVSGALDDEQTGWALPFVIRLRTDGRIVGSTRFLDLEDWDAPGGRPPGRPSTPSRRGTPSVGEIGSTWLGASAQRTPVNTECKLLLLAHAFDGWQMQRVTFKTDARNRRSRQAIERIGGRFEGIRRAHVPATDGTIRDSAYFSIIREEWPAVRDRLEARLNPHP